MSPKAVPKKAPATRSARKVTVKPRERGENNDGVTPYSENNPSPSSKGPRKELVMPTVELPKADAVRSTTSTTIANEFGTRYDPIECVDPVEFVPKAKLAARFNRFVCDNPSNSATPNSVASAPVVPTQKESGSFPPSQSHRAQVEEAKQEVEEAKQEAEEARLHEETYYV